MVDSKKTDNNTLCDNDYKVLQDNYFKLQERLKNYTNLQQELISANNIIDKKLDNYVKLNNYIKKIIKSESLKSFKDYIPDVIVDVFSAESSMVAFISNEKKILSTEGLQNKYNVDAVFSAIDDITSGETVNQPIYISQKAIDNHSSLKGFERIVLRKFESNSDNYKFYIIGFVSKKMSNNYEQLSQDKLLMFDNFSEQMHSILKHKISRNDLVVEKEKYRSIIANMNLGLLEVDNDENILLTNQSFSNMSGYSESELLGKSASKMLLDITSRKKMKKHNLARQQNQSSIYEMEIVTKQGENRIWLISGAPNYNSHGVLIGSIGIHLDITDQKKLEQNLLETNTELKKINSQLDTFVYRVSHDLRTPLLSIIGLLELIKLNSLDTISDVNSEYIALISDSATRLDVTIKDILYYSRNSRLDLDLTQVDLPKMVKNIYKDIKHFNKNEIKFETDFNGLNFIESDKNRLETILKNIIGNAVKYKKENSNSHFVKFSVYKEGSHYTFSVVDNGIGISQEHISKVFDMFFRATSKSVGTGLGLFIVKEIIEKLDGEITIDSTPDLGTTIVFKLPIINSNDKKN